MVVNRLASGVASIMLLLGLTSCGAIMKDDTPVATEKPSFTYEPVEGDRVAVDGVIPTQRVHGDDYQSNIPTVNSGIFSVMRDVDSIQNVLDYNDAIYNYMSKYIYKDHMQSKETLGHHLEPGVIFKTSLEDELVAYVANGGGETTAASHRGFMVVYVYYDETTKVATRQELFLDFCVDWKQDTKILVNEIADTIWRMLGVVPDVSDVESALSYAALGNSSFMVDDIEVVLDPCTLGYSHNAPQHIRVGVRFVDKGFGG